ncbi:hypothetical protein [Paenibacillus sp. y28]|uniref:hypothetical protein n=1 Tax=Paenibacillus sp. y28 TaxID=3129110 RepID=UPI003016597D
MSVIQAREEHTRTLGRLMRADCLDISNIRSIDDRGYQNPGGFEAMTQGGFYQRSHDQKCPPGPRRVLHVHRIHPAPFALIFLTGHPLYTKRPSCISVPMDIRESDISMPSCEQIMPAHQSNRQ